MAGFTYADLISWSEKARDWHRDALRRILIRPSLSEQDVLELTELAKGRSSPGHFEHRPASEEDIRQPTADGLPDVRILSISEIAHVNGLADGPVSFEGEGLTVIYGENATGKSGIARILKKACHARDSEGPILPNVFAAESIEKTPKATIDFLVDEEQGQFKWASNQASVDPDLKTVNVFDAKCAAVQVEEPTYISYTPEILEVFRTLAATIDRVKRELLEEKRKGGSRPSFLSELDLNLETPAGKLLKSFGPDTDEKEIDRICSLSDAERERLEQLRKILAEQDPKKPLRILESQRQSVSHWETRTVEITASLSDEKWSDIRQKLVDLQTSQNAAKAARSRFSEKSVLKGLGTAEWRALWEAAQRYSTQHAYKDSDFPETANDARCVLCQQPLSDEAADRFRAFHEFIESDIEQRVAEVRSEISEQTKALSGLSLPQSTRTALGALLPLDDPGIGALQRFLVTAKLRRRGMLQAMSALSPDISLPSLAPTPDLESLRESLARQITDLARASEGEGRATLETECEALKARETLAPHRLALQSETKRLRSVKEIDDALKTCQTTGITLKAREVAESIITNSLQRAFKRNLYLLGLNAPVEVKLGAGEYGKHPFQMELTNRPDIGPEEILSEGERTCVALAGFLAELGTTGNKSAIVLDDPVSSLDHRYRKSTAELLIREARDRQVIVLTHDPIFLFLLMKYSKELSCKLTLSSLERGQRGNYGRAVSGPPWIAMSVSRRIGVIRQELARARGRLNTGDRAAYERTADIIYKKLRSSWERAIEEVLLYGAVMRFSDSVQTKRLAKTIDITESDIELVDREMSRCSDYLHDESPAIYAGIPEPDTIERDISTLANWVYTLRTERGRK